MLAVATTYSTPSVSKKSKTSGLAKPPSGRIRRSALGMATRRRASRHRRSGIAPCLARLPGRNTAATTYGVGSALNVSVATSGR